MTSLHHGGRSYRKKITWHHQGHRETVLNPVFPSGNNTTKAPLFHTDCCCMHVIISLCGISAFKILSKTQHQYISLGEQSVFFIPFFFQLFHSIREIRCCLVGIIISIMREINVRMNLFFHCATITNKATVILETTVITLINTRQIILPLKFFSV